MNELNSSAFFDNRTLNFIRSVINGNPMNVISASETEIVKNKKHIIELNNETGFQLTRILDEHKNFIPVLDTLKFLVKANSKNKLDVAQEVLDAVQRSQRIMTIESLEGALKQAEKMPSFFAVNLMGNDEEGRHSENNDPEGFTELSHLNLNAMKDFK